MLGSNGRQNLAKSFGFRMPEPDRLKPKANFLLPAAGMRAGRPLDKGRKKPALGQRAILWDGQTPGPVAALEVNDLSEIDRRGGDNSIKVRCVDDPAKRARALGIEHDVGKRAGGVMGVGDDLGIAALQAVVVVHQAVGCVTVADVVDLTLLGLPDTIGNAHDVIDDVVIIRVEAGETSEVRVVLEPR